MMSNRWCGTFARVSASGLAVPTFMSRYTCAESTLTISPPKRDASASATTDLPAAVGPISSTAGITGFADAVLASAHEQPVEVVQAQLVPRRTSVIALTRALGCFHFA